MEITPVNRPLDATVRVPGSKSITNRALPIAALAHGTSRLSNVLFSDDSRYFMDCLQKLGFHLTVDEATHTVEVEGRTGVIPTDRAELYVGNAGTAARFLTAVLAIGHGTFRIDGNARMRERPIQDLLDALQRLGVQAKTDLGTGCPPVTVHAAGIHGGRTRVVGKNSSQYLSGLLLAAPYAANDITIDVEGELASQPYIGITRSMMAQFGVTVEQEGLSYRVPAKQIYQAREYSIEPDASNATYFMAAAAVCGGRIRVMHLTKDSLQGDTQFAHVLERMGCTLTWGTTFVEIVGPTAGQLSGIEIDMNSISDTAQTLAAIAPFASSPVIVRNVANMRIKETDRIAAVVTELRKLGVTVDEYDDGFRVEPCSHLQAASVHTYDDHRMAMAFSVIGLRVPGIVIEDPGCVDKTFPTFFDVLKDVTQTERLEG